MIFISLASCVGLTFILLYGKPTQFIRDFFNKKIPGLFECSLCLGFWSGVMHCIFLSFLDPSIWLLLLPCASSALSWMCNSLTLAIEMVEIYLKKKTKFPQKDV
jgi:hypothetical protein